MSDMRWSLKELYPSFESEKYKNDVKKIDLIIAEIIEWSDKNLETTDDALAKIETYLKTSIELEEIASLVGEYSTLTASVDSSNEVALQEEEKLMVKFTDLTESNVKFNKWLSSLDNLSEIINSSELLKEHEFMLNEIVKSTKYLLSDKEEVLLAKMSQTGSTSWEIFQEKVSSDLLVDINIDGKDEQLPLPVVRNMAYEADADLRKKAYFAELNAYKKIEESSAAALNSIKGEALTVTELRGYEDILDRTLKDSNMDKEILDSMFSAMKDSFPEFIKYFKRKAKMLGYKNGLPFYDLFAPMGKIDKKFTYADARKFVVENFRDFSDELANFADNAFEKNWIDAEPRKGKRGGAFCAGVHTIKESRIMANFTGTFSDLLTLAHELGHGYHGYCLRNQSILNSGYSMPVAETASIFCETIVNNSVMKTVSDSEKIAILESSISDAAQVIVDIYSRFYFESKMIERRKESSLSVEELKAFMVEAQKESYGEGLDSENLHPYMWLCKPHYYSAGANFYNFPYAFGLLFAKGLYQVYIEKGDEFIPKYKELLVATGVKNIYDIGKMMDIDLKDKAFWANSLKGIISDIDEFLELTEG